MSHIPYIPLQYRKTKIGESVEEKKAFIEKKSDHFMLICDSENPDIYVFGTVSLKDEDSYNFLPRASELEKDNTLVELLYKNLKEVMIPF
ncbi:MAG: hypothetical protein WC781_02245 [Candidatus Pacearchaeota archaeon]|jgi:hypothetical protein